MPKRKAIPFDGDPRTWYQLERWRKQRRAQLRIEPLCAFCLKRGRAVPATVADHVTPHDGDPVAFLCGQLQSLCKDCHDRDKRFFDLNGYELRPTIGVDGWPIERGAIVELNRIDNQKS